MNRLKTFLDDQEWRALFLRTGKSILIPREKKVGKIFCVSVSILDVTFSFKSFWFIYVVNNSMCIFVLKKNQTTKDMLSEVDSNWEICAQGQKIKTPLIETMMQIWGKTKQNLLVVFVFLDRWFFKTFALKNLKKKMWSLALSRKKQVKGGSVTIYFILAKKNERKTTTREHGLFSPRWNVFLTNVSIGMLKLTCCTFEKTFSKNFRTCVCTTTFWGRNRLKDVWMPK